MGGNEEYAASLEETRKQYEAALKETREISLEEYQNRYIAANHAMQSAVGFQMAHELRGLANEATIRRFKHNRVGINNAMSDHGALAFLLIEKGIITDEEYRAAVLAFVRREAESNAALAREQAGLPEGVRFG